MGKLLWRVKGCRLYITGSLGCGREYSRCLCSLGIIHLDEKGRRIRSRPGLQWHVVFVFLNGMFHRDRRG